MSLLYYSRIRLITQLLPLLLAAPQPAHRVSIYAAGGESHGTFFPNDLALKEAGHYNFSNCRTNVIYMKTMFFESLAQKHAGKLSLCHFYPAIVVTPTYYSSSHPWWFKSIFRLFAPLIKALSISPENIGQRVLFLGSDRFPAKGEESQYALMGTDGTMGGGAYSCNYNDEVNKIEKFYTQLRKQGLQEKVWEHTMEVFEQAKSKDATA